MIVVAQTENVAKVDQVIQEGVMSGRLQGVQMAGIVEAEREVLQYPEVVKGHPEIEGPPAEGKAVLLLVEGEGNVSPIRK